jgi:hypothetical protein
MAEEPCVRGENVCRLFPRWGNEMREAEKLFARILYYSMMQWSTVSTFRWLAQLGISHAPVYEEAVKSISFLDKDGVFDWLVINKDGSKVPKEEVFTLLGGVNAMAEDMARSNIISFQSSLDAASLIFAHTILDSNALDCCRVTALASPARWELKVENRQMPLCEMRGASYQELLGRKLDDYFKKELERAPLLTKLDVFHSVCHPESGFTLQNGYSYDRNRIKELDGLRHDIVHGRKVKTPFPRGDEDLLFMRNSCFYLIALVNKYFGIKTTTKDLEEIMKEGFSV